MPLTAAEIIAHPAFPQVIWKLEPAKKGKCPVASGRGGPIKLAYEIHGTGPRKIVVSAQQCAAKPSLSQDTKKKTTEKKQKKKRKYKY